MKISNDDCDAKQIEAFLNGELRNRDEALFAEHLNDCPECCDRLEQHAVWQEAEVHLKRTQFDGRSFDEAFATEEENLAARKPLQIQNVIDSLAPSEDPRMLGRLGNYEVSGVVGAGAMGVVLKATDPSLDRAIAIKVLSPHLASSGAARKRFAREAKAAAAVLHSNVIPIHSVSNEHSLPYLVMPYVRSTSLQKRIDQDGALPTNEVLRIASQVAAGLAAAHAQGLVHRDIKPANILLEQGVERVAITDFGLARAVDDASLTRTGSIAGTPQYMSPEQSRGDSIGQRSDLFSLGSVMYAMCVGRSPFRAETTYGVIQRINNDQPTPILELNPDVPAWLAGIIEKLMSKKVDDRFESAEEVSELLESCLAHVQHPSAVPLPPSIVVQPKSSGRFWGGSRRLIYTLGGAAAAGLTALAIMFFMNDGPPDISGKWFGDDWGKIVLEEKQPGYYKGKYDINSKLSNGSVGSTGSITVSWSPEQNQFTGSWETEGSGGDISLRLVNDEIRGAWNSNLMSPRPSNVPKLADLTWSRNKKAQPLAVADPSDKSSIPATEVAPDSTNVAALDVDPTKPGRLIMHYCHADGRPIRPLLKDPELRRLLDRQGTPDVSADGQRVAFDAWSTFDKNWENGRIVVCDIDGDNAHVITDGYMPTFSPDGKRLVFSRLPKYTKADGVSGKSIWICNVDGSGKEVVLQHGAWGARWSRDGKSLVFYNIDGVNDRRTHPPNCVRLYDFATKTTSNVFEPQDSPFNDLMYHYEWALGNQRTVIFAGRLKDSRNMVSATIDVDAGLKSLKTFDLNRGIHGVGYDWHPNGNDVLVDGDGDEALLLLSTETGEVSNPFVNLPANVSVRDATFTPDGKHLIASFSAMPARKINRKFVPPAKASQLKQQLEYSTRKTLQAIQNKQAKDADSEAEAQRLDNQRYETPQQSPEQ